MESAICIPEPVKFEDCGPTMAAAWTSQSEHFDEGPLCAVVHCMINFPQFPEFAHLVKFVASCLVRTT